jgi:hypothetical protein
VRYLAEGDANTKYFHMLARGRKRKNLITRLKVGGVFVTDHDEMEKALHDHFSRVFGATVQLNEDIDLQELGIIDHDLSVLDQPVSKEEVWAAIRELPSDRAPGPDGFTGAFYKTSWPIVKKDIMAAVNVVLFGDSRALGRLNGALDQKRWSQATIGQSP